MSTVIDVAPQTMFVWLELTPSCQLHCAHCYRSSAPGLGHGTMQWGDWKRVISSLRATGTQHVQFIGGEPTIHPHFCNLLEYAADAGLSIEVYSNLIGITPRMWGLFMQHRVRLATSFYTDEPAIHDAITGVKGSYEKTLANIKRALAHGLTLRVGMVRMHEGQRVDEGKAMLAKLGVKRIGIDRARGVGRGAQLREEDPVAALCGACTKGKAVITASGGVYNCIMSRSFPVGNVLEQEIAAILVGETMQATTAMLNAAFALRPQATDCDPDELDCDPECDPQTFPECDPDCCPETVASCEPSEDDDDDE